MPDVASPPPAREATSPRPAPPARPTRNHRWLLLLGLTPVIFGGVYALGSVSRGGPNPVVEPRSVPPGYTAVTDGYYGYAVPGSWKQNSAFSDANGDSYYNGPGGWVGEHESVRATAPGPSTGPPAALQAFGANEPSALTLTGGHHVDVPGATFAWAVTLTRAGGFRARALDVWERRSQTELWLMVRASPAIETRILSSLRASATN